MEKDNTDITSAAYLIPGYLALACKWGIIM